MFTSPAARLHFLQTPLAGAYVVEPIRSEDERGFFARTWCAHEFEAHGLNTRVAQSSISFNPKKGTWRGMHYQVVPHEEAKLVRCTMGAVWDVIVDLRSDSPTYRQHFGIELSAINRKMLYVPERFAHGFLTLADDTEVACQISEFHAPDSARGFAWNDSKFSITLPAPVVVISDRDRDYPEFNPEF